MDADLVQLLAGWEIGISVVLLVLAGTAIYHYAVQWYRALTLMRWCRINRLEILDHRAADSWLFRDTAANEMKWGDVSCSAWSLGISPPRLLITWHDDADGRTTGTMSALRDVSIVKRHRKGGIHMTIAAAMLAASVAWFCLRMNHHCNRFDVAARRALSELWNTRYADVTITNAFGVHKAPPIKWTQWRPSLPTDYSELKTNAMETVFESGETGWIVIGIASGSNMAVRIAYFDTIGE